VTAATLMARRSPDVPWLFYALAVVVGLFGLPFIFALTSYVWGNLFADYRRDEWGIFGVGLFVAVMFGGFHALLGAVFGAVWPALAWRWGVWLTALPLCLGSFGMPSVWLFAAFAAVTLLPACAAAHGAARMHLRYVGAG
jgi:hypothetical protein